MDAGNCTICKRKLNTSDPTTKDCGGDCLRCMAVYGLDPDCIEEMRRIDPPPRYQCHVAGCPANHVSKREICTGG